MCLKTWPKSKDEYSGIILTEKLEIHIIELKKLKVNNNPKKESIKD